jgi:hypothetical protein
VDSAGLFTYSNPRGATHPLPASQNSMLSRKPEDEFWGEEAGRRFVVQQEELVQLREENAALRKHVEAAEGISSGGGGVEGGHDSMQSQLSELQALVSFYEKKIGSLAEQQIISPQNDVPGGPSSDDWILEEHAINNEVFLLDRKVRHPSVLLF